MIRFDSSLRLLAAVACLGLAVASCQLVLLGSGAREMAYPGGQGEEMAVGSTRAIAVGAETPVSAISDQRQAASRGSSESVPSSHSMQFDQSAWPGPMHRRLP